MSGDYLPSVWSAWAGVPYTQFGEPDFLTAFDAVINPLYFAGRFTAFLAMYPPDERACWCWVHNITIPNPPQGFYLTYWDILRGDNKHAWFPDFQQRYAGSYIVGAPGYVSPVY